MEYKDVFAGKHITLMGLGLLGRGVGDAEFLARCGAQVLVTDKKSQEELAPSVEALKQYPNITFKLGGHDVHDFTACDMVVKAAGVRLDSPEIAAARKAGVPVVMSTALFAKYARAAGAKIVGVTGTRGKSSVTHMIFHTLRHAGRSAILGGNVRNISTLAMLPDVQNGDIAVLELDSWQLQGFGELELSPEIALFTNLMSDHQDYYNTIDEYFADKANIFKYQKEGDRSFVGRGVLARVKTVKPAVTPEIPEPIPHGWNLQVVGEHNRENAAFAAAALRALGLSEEEVKGGLESFKPVEGRLQFVREINGVKIYNDNNATTPEATVAALKALGKGNEKNITLIAGGSEKGLPLDDLIAEIKKYVAQVILLTHEKYRGSERLAEIFKREDVAFLGADSIENALRAALSLSHGGTILFSPAFASFGMFKNEYERNDEFLRLVSSADAS